MEQNTLTLSGDGSVAVLTLSRPHCLDIAGKHALLDAVNSLAARPKLRALIVAASHPQAWLVNVAELVEMSPTEARAFSNAGHQLADALSRLPVPVIAAVDATALGGGCELVLACDITLAGAAARFGQIEAMGRLSPPSTAHGALRDESGISEPCRWCSPPKSWTLKRPSSSDLPSMWWRLPT
jgi:enoyl-CoA hydratase/carnithine racemase